VLVVLVDLIFRPCEYGTDVAERSSNTSVVALLRRARR